MTEAEQKARRLMNRTDALLVVTHTHEMSAADRAACRRKAEKLEREAARIIEQGD